MGGMSIWHWIIVGGVLLLLFGGKGKVSDLMGDFAKGIKSFKKGMADDDVADAPVAPPVTPVVNDPLRSIDHRTTTVVDKSTETRRVG
jgi:sec-independent protein translocase protein TatA